MINEEFNGGDGWNQRWVESCKEENFHNVCSKQEAMLEIHK